MKLFKKTDSSFWWFDFTVRGQRYRGSTKETNEKRAEKVAALKLSQAMAGSDPLDRKPPSLQQFSGRFLKTIEAGRLRPATRQYYRDGWRLLSETPVAHMRIDRITTDDAEALTFSGSAPNANCALRTLRRMLHKAAEWNLIHKVPKITLLLEHGRSLILDENLEQKLIEAVASLNWRTKSFELFRDILVLMRDTGMRNRRELYLMRIENLDFKNRNIMVPDSKTAAGRRVIPMTDRVHDVLRRRTGDRTEGWVFPSPRSKSGHLTDMAHQFRLAREAAGLPRDLVLYCGRHDFGTRLLNATGNLKAVMNAMGHKDVKTAMKYQHPELETVRAVLNQANGSVLQASA